VALVRVPFYFINLFQTSLLYISILPRSRPPTSARQAGRERVAEEAMEKRGLKGREREEARGW
jgi:hypothetical protein